MEKFKGKRENFIFNTFIYLRSFSVKNAKLLETDLQI